MQNATKGSPRLLPTAMVLLSLCVLWGYGLTHTAAAKRSVAHSRPVGDSTTVFSDEFDDGNFGDTWQVQEKDDETITETDGHLIHESPKNYNEAGDMVTKDQYSASGIVTFQFRQRQDWTDYWESAVQIQFEGGYIRLREQKWGTEDRLKLSIDGENVEGKTETLAAPTSSSSWLVYSLTVNFDDQTVASASRGEETFNVNMSFSGISDDTYQIMIGQGRGHRTLYDYVLATADSSTSDSGGSLADAPWPRGGKDLRGTARSPYAGPEQDTVEWTFETGGGANDLSIGPDGTVYIGDNDGLHAVRPDGTEEWSYSGAVSGGGSRDNVNAAPAVTTGKTLYFGSDADYAHAVGPNGQRQWVTQICGQCNIGSSPAVVDDGTIYIGTNDGELYALNPDGSVQWTFDADGRVVSPAVAGDGTIYIGSGYLGFDGDVVPSDVYALNSDGTVQWSYEVGGQVKGDPTIGPDGTLYVGARDGKVYAFTPDGDLKWSFDTGGEVYSSPAIGEDGTIYVGSNSNSVYALAPDGTPKWQYETGGSVRSSPAVGGDGRVYVGSTDGMLYALQSDGTEAWHVDLGSPTRSSPAIGANGRVYVGAGSKLYAIGVSSPVDLTAEPGDGQVDLTWKSGDESNPAGYNVYRSTDSFSDTSSATRLNGSLVSDTSYTDTDVATETRYHYRVTAVDTAGNLSGPSAEAVATLQDLKLIGLEVNQSVQDWENSVPLVEDKKTVVRAHLRNERSGSSRVTVKLEGRRNGSLLPESPLYAENADDFEAPPDTSDPEILRERRSEMSTSLNFSLPASWLKGTVELKLAGYNIDCSAAAAIDNDCRLQASFEPISEPNITFFRVVWIDSDGNRHEPDLTEEDINDAAGQIRARFPISGLDYGKVREVKISYEEYFSSGPPTTNEVKNKLSDQWEEDLDGDEIGDGHIYFGIVESVERDSVTGSSRISGNVAFKLKDATLATTPHELAHVLGLQHAVNAEDNGTVDKKWGWSDLYKVGYCGSDALASKAEDFPYKNEQTPVDSIGPVAALGPLNQGENQEIWGIDTRVNPPFTPRSTQSSTPNPALMSYCPMVRWISDTSYKRLRDSISNRFTTPKNQILAGRSLQSSSVDATSLGVSQEEEYLIVRGQVDLVEDAASFRPFSSARLTPDEANSIRPEPDDFTLQVMDEEGNVLEEVPFEPEVGADVLTPESASFSIPVSSEPEIDKVQVRYEGNGNAAGQVLGSTEASQNPPSVTVQYPNGGEDLSGDEVTLEWTADDVDGDTLSYTVQYSRNGGSTWKTLATSWPHDSLNVDANTLGGTSNGLIRVQASDGFITAQDSSDGTFGSANVPPDANIFSPSDGAVTGQSGVVTLDGSGSDTEDGSLSGPALKWRTASGDSLGIGETIDVSADNFSLGTHTIELVATDSAGAADTASVSIQVALSNDPSLLASESVLVESDNFVDFGSTGTNIDFDGTSGAATVTAELYDSAPIGVGGIPESNVSHYRVLIDKQDGLTVGPGTTLRFETDTLSGIGDPTKVQIYQRPAPSNGPFTALDTEVDSMGTPSDPSDDEIYATTSEFGEFVLASDSEPLPVELASLDATLDGEDAARLTWTTASETGNAGFEVQRKAGEADEESWTTVGSVEGAGTTTEPTSYRYVDSGLPYEADRLTYRLKQVDTDGSVSYSKEVTVEREVKEAELLGTYPNPAQTQATLRYAVPERQDVKIHLYDILGRRVQTVVDGEREGRHKRQLDVSRLASGVYFLRLRAEGATKTQKLTVVR